MSVAHPRLPVPEARYVKILTLQHEYFWDKSRDVGEILNLISCFIRQFKADEMSGGKGTQAGRSGGRHETETEKMLWKRNEAEQKISQTPK